MWQYHSRTRKGIDIWVRRATGRKGYEYDISTPMEIQGRYYIPRVSIYQAQIPTGAARRDGRAPSHDGECVWVFWTTAEGLRRWIVEDNGGVSYTSESYTDVDVDEEELAEVLECIDEPGNQPFTGSGSEALDLMVLAGWLQPCDEPADE